MGHDAPPRREFPQLLDPLARGRADNRPRLVPLTGPRQQSITITVNLRALTALFVIPAVALAFTDSTLRSPLTAQVICWYTASLLLFCMVGVTVIAKRPQREERRYLLGAVVLLGLSLFEAAPQETWGRLFPLLGSLHHYPFHTIVMAATIACGALAIEAKRCERVSLSPALIVYLIGVVAGLLASNHSPEHALTGLLLSVSNLGRMLGPVLALRAILQYLSPPERPAALRFVLVS